MATEEMPVLYWTGFERYEDCPQKYLWYYGWQGVDVGGGPGKKKPLPKQRSEHHLFMGSVIQSVIEWIYVTGAWRDSTKVRAAVRDMLNKQFEQEIARRYIDWKEVKRPELYDICLKGVLGYLDTMVANRLVGDVMKAEAEYLCYLKTESHPIAVKVDLIIRRDKTDVLPGVTILDGKNSLHKGKYTNPDQLRWEALCYYLTYGSLPDRLGFVYYRYPAGTPIEGTDQKETGIDWVPYTLEEIKGLAARAIVVHDCMQEGKFDPQPVPKVCRFCDYETVCEARQTTKRKRKPKAGSDILGVGDGEDWAPREIGIS